MKEFFTQRIEGNRKEPNYLLVQHRAVDVVQIETGKGCEPTFAVELSMRQCRELSDYLLQIVHSNTPTAYPPAAPIITPNVYAVAAPVIVPTVYAVGTQAVVNIENCNTSCNTACRGFINCRNRVTFNLATNGKK